MPGMFVCKLFLIDVVREVTCSASLAHSSSISHCGLVQVSSCAPATSCSSRGRQVWYMRGAVHSGILVAGRRLISFKNVERRPDFLPGKGRCNFSCSIYSPSRLSRKNASSRLRCKAESSLVDASKASTAEDRNSSDNFRDSSSNTRRATTREDTSASVSSPPLLFEGGPPVNLAAVVGVTAAVFVMAVLGFKAKPPTNGGGSVSDLIRRGQLRSDRGGADSKNLRYDDPFNNPLVRMGNRNPIVKMCGKMFRLAPVTLTEEKVVKHQNRRIQAYRWKRPILFLNEGDPVPEGVDPDEVRWIPSNHPFATTSDCIDEDLAQKNVYQTRGIPSRVRLEHEALRKKILETAQREPEFQLPSMDNSGAQAWNIVEESPAKSGSHSGNEDEGSGSAVTFGKQVNGKGEFESPSSNGSDERSPRKSASESRYRTIDFSGEQGPGRASKSQ